MVPMLKTEKGWLLQVRPDQLTMIRESCWNRKISLSNLLLILRKITKEDADELRAEVQELKGIIDSIDRSLKATALQTKPDFTVEVELPPTLQL